jgi:hypothetical protein
MPLMFKKKIFATFTEFRKRATYHQMNDEIQTNCKDKRKTNMEEIIRQVNSEWLKNGQVT